MNSNLIDDEMDAMLWDLIRIQNFFLSSIVNQLFNNEATIHKKYFNKVGTEFHCSSNAACISLFSVDFFSAISLLLNFPKKKKYVYMLHTL
jgi:hypothetical protein